VASDERDKLIAEMESIRRQGLRAAEQFSHDMTRLADWREHIRASPLPFVIAAAAAGYVVIPASRRDARRAAREATNIQVERSGDLQAATVRVNTASSLADKLRATALSYAGRWMRTVVSDFVQKQIRTVVEHRDDRADRLQRTHAKPNGSASLD
jgi:hypothetical protein